MLSPAEKDYLFKNLVQPSPIRPDARRNTQFRPLEAKTDFLPSSNGLARIRSVDGLECIVSVKLRVEELLPQFIEVDVDVSGYRDDSNFVLNLKFNLTSLFSRNFPLDNLKLTKKYGFKLYVDCIVTCHTLYPLSLISLTTYLALKTTRLPLLISSTDDDEIAELPTFSDDWDMATMIAENILPPIFIVIGVIGNNLLFDPSNAEEQVLESGIVLSYYQGKAITPISKVNLCERSSSFTIGGMSKSTISHAIQITNEYCGEIIKALDRFIESDNSQAIF